MTPRRPAASPPNECAAYTVESFAAKHAISRSQAFKEINAGRLVARKVGSRTIITKEDAAKWRRALPKANNKDARKAPYNGLPLLPPGASRESGLK